VTDLGRCAADLVAGYERSNGGGTPVASYDPVELALGMVPG